MTHECNAASLRRATEKSNLGLLLFELVGIYRHGIPSGGATCSLVVFEGCELSAETSIGLHDAFETNLKQWD